MLYYLYDGSFEGLLTAIYKAFYAHKDKDKSEPDFIINQDKYQPSLFSETKEISTEQKKADKVYQAIEKKISKGTLTSVYYAFLSELEEIEITIYNYLKLGFKKGAQINKFYSNPTVSKIKKTRKKVSRLAHRMKGLLRFRALANGVYYAPMEPEHNITPVIAPHFVNRFSDQDWIIHDLKRKSAAIYNQEEWVISDLKERELPLAEEENEHQQLWQEFFSSISIKNRHNPKLQQQNMPKKYWKYLIEKD